MMDAVRNRMETEDHRTLGTLLRDLRDETTTLLRQEVALAKTEMSEKAAATGRNVGYLAAGGMVLLLGAIFLLLAVTCGVYAALTALDLSPYIAGWLAPLIVGAVVAGIGYVLVQKGLTALKHTSPVPEQTKETLQENKRWLEQKVS